METANPDPNMRLAFARPHTGEGGALNRTGFAWAVFEWARNPYYILVVIYIFAPYFARDIIGADLLASGALDELPADKALAAANMLLMSVTAAVFQLEMSPLKALAQENM